MFFFTFISWFYHKIPLSLSKLLVYSYNSDGFPQVLSNFAIMYSLKQHINSDLRPVFRAKLKDFDSNPGRNFVSYCWCARD